MTDTWVLPSILKGEGWCRIPNSGGRRRTGNGFWSFQGPFLLSIWDLTPLPHSHTQIPLPTAGHGPVQPDQGLRAWGPGVLSLHCGQRMLDQLCLSISSLDPKPSAGVSRPLAPSLWPSSHSISGATSGTSSLCPDHPISWCSMIFRNWDWRGKGTPPLVPSLLAGGLLGGETRKGALRSTKAPGFEDRGKNLSSEVAIVPHFPSPPLLPGLLHGTASFSLTGGAVRGD